MSAGQVLITGGTGFLGRALCRYYIEIGATVAVLTRDATRARQVLPPGVAIITESLHSLSGSFEAGVIFNLAGRNLASARWNEARKQGFIDSRVDVTNAVVEYIAGCVRPPAVLVSGSAVGYYGARGDEKIDEQGEPADEFQSRLCRQWEQAALAAQKHGTRVCLMRSGAVLGPGGGPLAGLLPPFRLGLGGYLGDGNQWLSWIHIRDWVRLAVHLTANNTLSGAFNATSPRPETNRAFARQLAATLGRPAWLRIPGFMVRLQAGEMAHLLLTGQRVIPDRARASGFRFRYADLGRALADILKKQ